MTTSTEERKDCIPRWNGRLETVDDFEANVRTYVLGTKKDERYLCGPRLIGVMSDGTAVKRQALAFDIKELQKEDGAQKLLEYLKEKMGNQAPIDLMKSLVQYLYQMARRRGESMVAFGNREHELYHRLERAYHRVRPPAGEDKPDVCLESELRGVLLLYNSGLETTERASVLSAARHQYSREEVLRALIGNWPEDELRRRDGAGHAAHGIDQESEESEQDEAFGLDEEDSCDATAPDEEDIGYAESDQERAAIMMMQQAKRTFKEARNLLMKNKVNRGYYPTVERRGAPPLGQPIRRDDRSKGKAFWQDRQSGDRRPDRYPRGDRPIGDRFRPDRKPMVKSWSRDRGIPDGGQAAPTVKKCLKCGKTGHVTKDCPELKGGRPSFSGFVGCVSYHIMDIHEKDIHIFGAFSFFNMSECFGKVIVDSGASQSMAGLPWLLAVQDEIFSQYGEDLVDVDPSYRAEFTFANGAKDSSLGRITIPAFISEISGKLTFTGLDKPGPALLGMDHLQALGFCVDFETGRCVVKALGQDFQLPRLANGHLVLDILNHPGKKLSIKAVTNDASSSSSAATSAPPQR